MDLFATFGRPGRQSGECRKPIPETWICKFFGCGMKGGLWLGGCSGRIGFVTGRVGGCLPSNATPRFLMVLRKEQGNRDAQ